jgi:hypothetical protein
MVSAFEASERGVATQVEVVPREPLFFLFDGAFAPDPEKLVFVGCWKTGKDLV